MIAFGAGSHLARISYVNYLFINELPQGERSTEDFLPSFRTCGGESARRVHAPRNLRAFLQAPSKVAVPELAADDQENGLQGEGLVTNRGSSAVSIRLLSCPDCRKRHLTND